MASVTPFEACFDSRSIGNSITGFVVPTIDLVRATRGSAMAKKNVACPAFVDRGTMATMSFFKASIVIGAHQLEENLLVFDVASSKLSFSSSLSLHNVIVTQQQQTNINIWIQAGLRESVRSQLTCGISFRRLAAL